MQRFAECVCVFIYIPLSLSTYIKLLFDSYLQASIKCKHSWHFVQSRVLRKQRRRSSYDTAKDAASPSLELRDGGRGRNLSDTGSASETNRLFLFHSCAHGTQEQPLSLSLSLWFRGSFVLQQAVTWHCSQSSLRGSFLPNCFFRRACPGTRNH